MKSPEWYPSLEDILDDIYPGLDLETLEELQLDEFLMQELHDDEADYSGDEDIQE